VNHQRDERLTTIVRQMMTETGPEAFVRQLNAIMSRPDSRPLLSSIKCPTMVLVGEDDVATPPELNKEIAAGISGAKLTIVPDSGHLSTLEKPDAVNAALTEWLAA
jgi:pimeloyl-ACP methyl ester carboxylesterase